MDAKKRCGARGQEPDFDYQRLDADDDGNAADIPRPLTAIRKHCLWCCNGSALEVNHCPAKSCPLWPYRFGKKPTEGMLADVDDIKIYPLEGAVTRVEFCESGGTVLKAIKRRCLDCSGYSKAEVRNCPFVSCNLHPYKLGTNPNRAMSPEQAKLAAERLRTNARSKRGS